MKHCIYSSTEPYINPELFNNVPFVCDTDVSLYNNYLNPEDAEYARKKYNRVGEVVMMTPNEYFSECSKYGFPDGEVNLDHLTAGRRADTESLAWLENRLDSGEKFYLPYLNYADHTQEGLHRMMIAGDRYGWDTKFPVLVVNVADEIVEHENRVFSAYKDFRDYKFDRICENAAYVLDDWLAFPDDTFGEDLLIKNLADEIVKEAQNAGYDIDVNIEIEEVDDVHLLNVYIDRFEDYDSSERYDGCRLIFEDYMSTEPNNSAYNFDDPWLDDNN